MNVSDVLTSGGRHPERPQKWPPNAAMIANAGDLCSRVNWFLQPFYAVHPLSPERAITSGYRPPAINIDIPGAVPGDAHEDCNAVDLSDGGGSLAVFCLANVDRMKQAGLYMEDPRYTRTLLNKGRRGWVHLQRRPVPSGHVVFIPYNHPPEEDSQ